MNIEKLIKMLQTKVASLGYNKKELRGIAEEISNNSELGEDATDEAINAEIEAVMPYLKFGQQQANRIASAGKPADGQGGDGGAKPPATPPQAQPKPEDEAPQWAKALFEQNKALSEKLAAMEGERKTNSRLDRIKEIVKDCGAMGEATLRGFGRMQFSTEEDFEEFVQEVEASVEAYRRQEGNEALETHKGKPGGAGANNPTATPTQAEIDALAEAMG